MKKILFSFLILMSLNSYSYSDNIISRSELSNKRGLELMRLNNYNELNNISKKSGSLQISEAFYGKYNNYKSRGFLLGVSSNFVKYPNIQLGLTTSYEKINFNEGNSHEREYELNTYISYNKDLYLLIANLGYSQAKKLSRRAYTTNFEIGKFSQGKSYSKDRLYYYTGLDLSKWKYKKYEKPFFQSYRVGISSYKYFDKFRLISNLEMNLDNKKYFLNRSRFNVSFSSAIGYKIYDDLLVELKYRGTKSRDIYNYLISLGFEHSF